MALSHPMVLRVAAAQATHDRFAGRALDWKAGIHCLATVAFHMKRMGYPVRTAAAGSYASETGAVRALRRMGFDHPHDALLHYGLEEIPHSRVLTGDILSLRSAGEWPALAVRLSNGRVLTSSAEHPVFGAATPDPENILTAWRCEPAAHRIYKRFRPSAVGSGGRRPTIGGQE